MNAKKLTSIFILIGIVMGITAIYSVFLLKKEEDREPIIFTGEIGLLAEMDIDNLISEADVIAIGKFEIIPPSQWNTPDGELPFLATGRTIWDEGLFIYTEQFFQASEILKKDPKGRVILVRTFGGQVGEDIMTPGNSNEVAYEAEKTYLLFLSYYPDRVQDSTSGYFVATGSYQGVYEIIDGKAISESGDIWIFEDLITYIKESPLSAINIPDTPEVKEIIQRIETAYDIEAEAGYDFDLSKLPTVFVNDFRYKLDNEKIDFIRLATDNPSLEAAGYLEYKIAYYNWWHEGQILYEGIREKAISESRNVSDEELNTFLATKWKMIPGVSDSPERFFSLKFVSIIVDDDIATAVLGFGAVAKEFSLVLIDDQWFIANEKSTPIFR